MRIVRVERTGSERPGDREDRAGVADVGALGIFDVGVRVGQLEVGDAVDRERQADGPVQIVGRAGARIVRRSEEHTSELQSLMRISYAVFCLKKKKTMTNKK